jgi:hypothetical protein
MFFFFSNRFGCFDDAGFCVANLGAAFPVRNAAVLRAGKARILQRILLTLVTIAKTKARNIVGLVRTAKRK